jgi:hypothetical protein
MGRRPDVTVAAIAESGGRFLVVEEARQPRLRSPLVLRCVRDYLSGRRHALDHVAQLDLERAAALEAHAIAMPA